MTWPELAPRTRMVGFAGLGSGAGGVGSGRRTAGAATSEPSQWLNVLSTAGASVLALGLLLTVGYLTAALFRGRKAGPNPWGSRSFEWRTSSPPPRENFRREPPFEIGAYDYSQPLPDEDT